MPKAKRITEQPLFENCKIIFKNFSGEQSQYNRAGDRNFCVVIDDLEIAAKMKEDGWNVKYLPPLDEGEEETAYLPVTISFAIQPPTVKMFTSRGSENLDESTISTLDYAQLKTVDLIVNPYNWEVNGKHGVKAYVKSLYVVLEEDALAKKYAGFDTSDPSDDLPF